jgi:hypothetical protein
MFEPNNGRLTPFKTAEWEPIIFLNSYNMLEGYLCAIDHGTYNGRMGTLNFHIFQPFRIVQSQFMLQVFTALHVLNIL